MPDQNPDERAAMLAAASKISSDWTRNGDMGELYSRLWSAGRAYERERAAVEAERMVRIEDAADRMATAIRLGLRDGLRDCQEACDHPGCEMIRARKAHVRAVGASVPSEPAS